MHLSVVPIVHIIQRASAVVVCHAQFVDEDEILFPPMTMLQVLHPSSEGSAVGRHLARSNTPQNLFSPGQIREMQDRIETERHKERTFQIIDVLPCFL